MQATIVIPYPGSTLFAECQKGDLLKTLHWPNYDMKRPVMKSSISDKQMSDLVRGVYKVAFHPEFIFHRLASLKSFSDFAYFFRGIKKVFGHIVDFGRGG